MLRLVRFAHGGMCVGAIDKDKYLRRLPWLERVSGPEGAREYVLSLPARSPWVAVEAKKFLGLEVGV